MSVSIIDGRVDLAEVKQKRGKFSVYRTLRFALSGGGERTLKNAVASTEVAAHLQPGTAGRFYLFSGGNGRGVHAYRDPAGSVTHAYPRQNEKLLLWLIPINLAAILLFEVLGEGTPIIILIALLIAVIGYVFARRSRGEAERALAADDGARAPATASALP